MDRLIPFDSLLFQDLVGTPAMRAVWTGRRTLETWMAVEAAITRVQAELGLIPAWAAAEITRRLTPDHLTPERIREKQATVGHLMVAFLKAFREICGPAAEHFHVGPTTQDILDTGLTLQIDQAHAIVFEEAWRLEDALCAQAECYRQTPVAGRTHQQHAAPLTFGFVLAGWALELHDHLERALEGEARWRVGMVSGAVGTHSAFVELSDLATARLLERRVCEELGLAAPRGDLHRRTDRFAEVAGHLAGLCSHLGRIGLDIRGWQRPEVGEVEEPSGPLQYSSSTMPNKRNPEASEQVEGLATLCRALSLAMQDLQMSEHRDSTRMPVEFTALPLSFLMTARALETTRRTVEGLVVHADAMLENLSHPRVRGQTAGERIMIALYRKTGRRDAAHTRLHACAQRSRAHGIPFRDAILQDPELAPLFDEGELDRLLDLTTYLGSAAQQVDEAVAYVRQSRADQQARRGRPQLPPSPQFHALPVGEPL